MYQSIKPLNMRGVVIAKKLPRGNDFRPLLPPLPGRVAFRPGSTLPENCHSIAVMRSSSSRQTSARVRDRLVGKLSRHVPTCRLGFVLDRESPGQGYRHVLTQRFL